MNDQRRELLIGYLLGALEPQESSKVDAEMLHNENLRNELAVLYREIYPINEIADHYEPPVGLATRTCRDLWAIIDSSQNSQITNTLHPPKSNRKKRKITVVVSQDAHQQEDRQASGFRLQTSGKEDNLEAQDLNPDALIPLSQALLQTSQSPQGKPGKILRRIDQAIDTPGKPHPHLVDSMVIVKNHPSKHYGRKSKNLATKIKRPWTMRDVFASLLVGLVAAVVIFPIVQMGINSFREMITQQQIQNFANSIGPNTSQSSLYGLSPNDAQIIITNMNIDITNMNIDPQAATASYNQRQNAATPAIHPVHLSGEVAVVRQPDSTQ